MGIAYSTLRTWRDKFSSLPAALKRGKNVVDRQVEKHCWNLKSILNNKKINEII